MGFLIHPVSIFSFLKPGSKLEDISHHLRHKAFPKTLKPPVQFKKAAKYGVLEEALDWDSQNLSFWSWPTLLITLDLRRNLGFFLNLHCQTGIINPYLYKVTEGMT